MEKRATLKQIASELNVSISTVSKALNGSSEISKETIEKVTTYAKLRNYRPNAIGVNLKNRKTKTIGVIIPNILNPFFAKVFSGIEKVAENKGYNVITCISNESLKKEVRALEMLSSGTIDGLIISVSEEAQTAKSFGHLQAIIDQGFPIVMFDRLADDISSDKVVVDDMDSAFKAVNHLILMGRKKIALFSSIDKLNVGKLRAEGFRKALLENNIDADDSYVVVSDSPEEFENNAERFFKDHRPDGIFALDEHASVYALNASIKKGYKVPEDIAIIGFADGTWSRRFIPSLSTVSQHGPEIGGAAATLLINRLETAVETPFETREIKTEIRHRDSTRVRADG